MPRVATPVLLTLTLCVAEVLTMAGVFAFPALMPGFQAEWDLSSTDAGWIAGIYFAGYGAAVPLLVAFTDRIDARRIYILSAALTAAAAVGFALLAEGFWSALLFRALAGAGLAGTYMPGLKVLVDRYQGPRQSRAVAFYTSSFSLGTALSYLVAGEVAALLDWRAVFGVAAVAALSGAALVFALTAPLPPRPPAAEAQGLPDVRPVFRNRPALGAIIAYCVHCWELFGLRSWLVAFLVFAAAMAPQGTGGWPSPTTVAMLSGLAAVAASLIGQELSARFGSARVIPVVMTVSALTSCVVGFSAGLPYPLVVGLMLLFTVTIQLDSAALTAAVIRVAEPGRQGATLAVHTMAGFGGGFLGALAPGMTLDLAGGAAEPLAWGLAFASMGAITLLGAIALKRLSRE